MRLRRRFFTLPERSGVAGPRVFAAPRRAGAERGVAIAIALTCSASVACGDGTSADPFVRAPALADAAADAPADAPTGVTDAGKLDPSLGGPCIDDGQCNDNIACTLDACDKTLPVGGAEGGVGRCRFTVDDAQCADDAFCNGRERCLLGVGCRPGPPETCQDQDSCTIDSCDEATKSCKHAPRDLDGDGDPDDRCSANHDCDDQDPDVASTRGEVCSNGRDDDCDGQVDEVACVSPKADTCAAGLAITAPGTYGLTLAAAAADYPLSCSIGGKDVVALVTIPAGAPRDLDLWARAAGAELALAVQSTCGVGASELVCRSADSATRVRARNLAPGTYAVVVKSVVEADVELAVDFLPASAPPANETCATAAPLTVGTAELVSFIDAAKDVASACTLAAGELTYSLSLAAPADVKIFTSVLAGAGVPVVSLLKSACGSGDEVRCKQGLGLPLFARNVAAGNYVVTVGASTPMDLSVLVVASAPTIAGPGDSCVAAPKAVHNAANLFDLGDRDDDIDDSCFEQSPDLAFDLELTAPSDVLLVGRFPPGDTGSVSLGDATCSSTGRLACGVSDSPVRVSRRNVAAGSHGVVLADTYGRKGSLDAWVRPTTPPVDVNASDSCGAGLIVVPPSGGYFFGNTTSGLHDFSNGCDQAFAPAAPDQILRLDLTKTQRVILDMSGSTFTTLLNVRTGATCPGAEVPGACHVGFGGNRSFLDRSLPAGTYWIVVDGFNGDGGNYGLDIRVVDP